MERLPKLILPILLLLAVSAFGKGKPENENFLLTANSAGRLRLGMTISEVREAMPSAAIAPDLSGENVTRYEFNYLPASIFRNGQLVMSVLTPKYDEEGRAMKFNENSPVASIKIWDPRYRTKKGVHTGMLIAEAEKFYGGLTEIFGFYGNDESAHFARHPEGFEFLVSGRRSADGKRSAGLYEDGRADFAYKYTAGAFIRSITISGGKKAKGN